MKTDAIANELSLNGFAHVRDLSKGLNISSTEKDALSFWWRNLVIDENFRQYTSRERRILRYQVSSRTPDRLKINLNPNYSSRVNYDAPYQRGVNVLAYAEEGFIHDSTLNRVLKFDLAVTLAAIKSVCCLDVDIHQFRVNARFGRPSPTTSGIHQDGYDFVFMHFIRSYNTRPVTSEIFSTPNKGSLCFQGEINKFMETLVVNDRTFWHRASAIRQKNINLPASRDILIVSCRQSEAEASS